MGSQLGIERMIPDLDDFVFCLSFLEFLFLKEFWRPIDQVHIELMVAHSAEVDGSAFAVGIHCQGWLAGVDILGEGRQHSAFFWFDDVVPELRRMQVAGREGPFKFKWFSSSG